MFDLLIIHVYCRVVVNECHCMLS